MNKKTILLISLLITANTAWAEFNLLENAAKQVAKDAATAAAPETVKNVEAASQTVEQAVELQNAVTNAPEVVKQQAEASAKAAVKQKIAETATSVAPNAVQDLKAANKTIQQVNQLKQAVSHPDALKKQAQHKTEKAVNTAIQKETTKAVVDLLH